MTHLVVVRGLPVDAVMRAALLTDYRQRARGKPQCLGCWRSNARGLQRRRRG
jgi:hypothetical protein